MKRNRVSSFMDAAGSSAGGLALIVLIPLFLIYGPCWLIYYAFNHKAVHAKWKKEKADREEHRRIDWLLKTAQNRHEVMSAMYNRHGENFTMEVIASDGTKHQIRCERM